MTFPSVDYYAALGVRPDADQRAIRSAYRRLARRFHPDLAKDRHSTKDFLLLREAYDVLSDPEKRRRYDRALAESAPRRRPAETRSAPSSEGTGAAVEPAGPRRGFRVVLNVLGIRIDAGMDRGKD